MATTGHYPDFVLRSWQVKDCLMSDLKHADVALPWVMSRNVLDSAKGGMKYAFLHMEAN